ncbi:MAG: UDP-N-acetylmuramoyl-L-alanine--D-glutamate ligase, partial [Gemmatimonadota bacterium]
GRRAPFGPGDRVAVVGLGASGTAAARLVHRQGGDVYASDHVAGESQRAAAESLREEGVDAETGRHDLEKIRACSLAVVSPGVAPTTEVRRELRETGIRTIAEIELAYRFLPSRLVAVTGTNGKTTTTALCGHTLRTAGLDAETAGNIGRPLSAVALREEPPDWVVVEVSSFQLSDIEEFRPQIGVLLNLAPDHLDRYRNVDRYYADKRRLFDNASRESRWVVNADDDDVMSLVDGTPGELLHYSTERRLAEGAFLDEGGRLRLQLAGRSETWCTVDDLQLVGRHNVSNALAAGLAAALAGCEPGGIGDGLSTFEALPHRLEPVGRDDRGVLWVNDSKATNVAATSVAVQAFDEPYVLVMGGRGKGEPFDDLAVLLRARARGLVAFGESAPQIVAELGDAVPELRTESGMEAVVRAAAGLAEPGDVVLFSPACSSFDMYPDYGARGEAFERAVRRLVGEGGRG